VLHPCWSHSTAHTHAASERAATHTCPTRKQARHLPDILCGLTHAPATAPKRRPESRARKITRSPQQRGPLRAPTAKLYRRPLRSTQAWRCARCATSRVAACRVRVLVRT
jgi:hypothetical protein